MVKNLFDTRMGIEILTYLYKKKIYDKKVGMRRMEIYKELKITYNHLTILMRFLKDRGLITSVRKETHLTLELTPKGEEVAIHIMKINELMRSKK